VEEVARVDPERSNPVTPWGTRVIPDREDIGIDRCARFNMCANLLEIINKTGFVDGPYVSFGEMPDLDPFKQPRGFNLFQDLRIPAEIRIVRQALKKKTVGVQ